MDAKNEGLKGENVKAKTKAQKEYAKYIGEDYSHLISDPAKDAAALKRSAAQRGNLLKAAEAVVEEVLLLPRLPGKVAVPESAVHKLREIVAAIRGGR